MKFTYFLVIVVQTSLACSLFSDTIPAVDPNIHLEGYMYPDGDSMLIEWSGSSITFTVKSDSCKVLFGKATKSKYRVRINGRDFGTVKVEPVIDLTKMLKPDKKSRIELIKITEPCHGRDSFVGIELGAKGSFLKTKMPLSKKILFLGDSITVGKESPELHQTDVTSSYASMVARKFDADFRVLGESGIGVYRGWQTYTFKKIWSYVSEKEKEHFTKQQRWFPDLIVVNLGTNDAGRGAAGAEFYGAMKELMNEFLTFYPDTKMVILLPWTYSTFPGQLKKIVEELNAKSCKHRVRYIQTNKTWRNSKGMSDSVHPNLLGHKIAAIKLTKAIKKLKGWGFSHRIRNKKVKEQIDSSIGIGLIKSSRR